MDMNKSNNKIEILSPPEKVDMADDWYQYATLEHFWIKARFRAIESKLTTEEIGTNLFEIGCGHGAVIKQFEEKFDVTVDGCDLNMLALNDIKDVKGRILCLNIFDKPTELLRSYDSVLLMDVIEHIENDSDFLVNCLEYVKEGGLVIINVPALNILFSKYDLAAGHKRRYNKRMMKELFAKCNIEVVSVYYWGFLLIPIAIIRKMMLNFVSKEQIISTGFSPPSKTINRILNWLLAAENKLVKSPILGTSLVAIGKIRRAEK
jgi:SAM-dependent methyltransferase